MGWTKERASDERQHFDAPSDTPFSLPIPRAAPSFPAPAPVKPAVPALAPRLQAAPRAMLAAFEDERAYGNGFLFIPVFIAAGALAYFTLNHEPPLLPLLAALVLFAGLALVSRSHPFLRAALLAALMTAIGMVSAKVDTWRASTPMLGSEITTVLTGRVVAIEHQASGRTRLTLDVIETHRPTLRYAPARVRATARTVPDGLRPGDMIEGVVRLMPASGPVRPESYDFAFKGYFSGIGGSGFFLSTPVRSAVPASLTITEATLAVIEDWRMRMATRISDQIGGTEGAIAAALITGIRAGIPEDINEALRIVGLYHVISISGLHMALVGGTVMVSLRALFALAPSFSARRPVKKYAAAAALAATSFYLLISGADVAAQRSFIMLGVMLVAVLFDRAALTLRNLAISAIIILLMAPHEVMGPSFQMSFAATAALVAAYAAWTNWRAGRPQRKPPRYGPVLGLARSGLKYAGGMSMTSVVAGLATALFTAWHFQQVSPMGLAANLAAMPFVSVIVMPMAVLASLLMPLGLDGFPLYLMGVGIAGMNAVAIWLAERSAFDATGAIPLSAVLTLTAALAILTMSGTSLRWAAMPLIIAGGVMLFSRDLPDIFVSEDGALVALRLEDGRVAVNRPRPRAFTIQNWQRALDADSVVPPRKATKAEADARVSSDSTAGLSAIPSHGLNPSHGPRSSSGTSSEPGVKPDSSASLSAIASHSHYPSHGPRSSSGTNSEPGVNPDSGASLSAIPSHDPNPSPGPGFSCSDGLCVAAYRGTFIVHAADRTTAANACTYASLIVIDDATAQNPCGVAVSVITKRDLARHGSAEIHLRKIIRRSGDDISGIAAHAQSRQTPPEPQAEPEPPARYLAHTRFSIAEPYRPWHEYRRFSRAARGMPPWQRPERQTEPTPE